jgi:hypothetical protein
MEVWIRYYDDATGVLFTECEPSEWKAVIGMIASFGVYVPGLDVFGVRGDDTTQLVLDRDAGECYLEVVIGENS